MHVFVYPCRQFWNGVDTNLFRLGSTNPKKNPQNMDVFFGGVLRPRQEKKITFFFFQDFHCEMFEHFLKKNIFFSKKKIQGSRIFFRIGGP